jgi:L-glyceraldehyde reductase
MEKLVRAGKIRSIGVSNFTIEKMEELLKTAEIPPAVNQIEAHPYLLQPKLFQYLKENTILPVAYSPLGNNIFGAPRVVDDPAVIEIAKRLGKDPAGLLISWAVQRGSAAIPKSVTAARIESNFQGIYQPPQSSISLTDQHVSVRLHHP